MSGTYRNKSSTASWCSSSPAPLGSTRSWWDFRAPPSVCCRWWTRCTNYSHPVRTSAVAFRIFYRWFCGGKQMRVPNPVRKRVCVCAYLPLPEWEKEESKKKKKRQKRKCLWSVCFSVVYLLFQKKTDDVYQGNGTDRRGKREVLEASNTLTSSGRSSNYLDRFSVFFHLEELTAERRSFLRTECLIWGLVHGFGLSGQFTGYGNKLSSHSIFVIWVLARYGAVPSMAARVGLQ